MPIPPLIIPPHLFGFGGPSAFAFRAGVGGSSAAYYGGSTILGKWQKEEEEEENRSS